VKAERESFSRLRDLIRQELDDTSVRSPRSMKLIFHTFVVNILKALGACELLFSNNTRLGIK
jgi:hypothetical protein